MDDHTSFCGQHSKTFLFWLLLLFCDVTEAVVKRFMWSICCARARARVCVCVCGTRLAQVLLDSEGFVWRLLCGALV